jgi:hypothetical protein
MEVLPLGIANGPAAHPVADRHDGGKTAVVEGERIRLGDRYQKQDFRRAGRAVPNGRGARSRWTAPGRARQETEAVKLAQHSITRDVAQSAGDLAGGQAVLPEGFEVFDATVGPI